MAQTGLMSELEAVNKVLAVAGDTPVQSLEDGYQQAILARKILERMSRKVQSMGWWFNEEECVELVPNTFGQITLATNCISAVVNNDDGSIIQRGNRMYNREDRTYTFTENLDVNLILALEWNELPQVAREFITDAACSQYNNDYFGAEEIKQHLSRNEASSFIELKKADVDARDINMLNNNRSYNIAFRNRR